MSNLGPHVHAVTNANREWVQRASVVKQLDGTDALRIARDDAYRIYRRYFQFQNLTDPNDVAAAVLDGLGGYRHPRLYVEPYVGMPPGLRNQHADWLAAFAQSMHRDGVLVCGPSWYTGNGTREDAEAFAFVDAWACQCYWGRQGFTEDNALRFLMFPQDRPVFVTECGRDNVEGWPGPGWDGLGDDMYVGELRDYGRVLEARGVYGTAYTAGSRSTPDKQWWPFDVDPLIGKLLQS